MIITYIIIGWIVLIAVFGLIINPIKKSKENKLHATPEYKKKMEENRIAAKHANARYYTHQLYVNKACSRYAALAANGIELTKSTDEIIEDMRREEEEGYTGSTIDDYKKRYPEDIVDKTRENIKATRKVIQTARKEIAKPAEQANPDETFLDEHDPLRLDNMLEDERIRYPEKYYNDDNIVGSL